MSPTNTIRFGVIGCSNIAARATIPAILASEAATLVAVASRSFDRAKEYAKRFGCDATKSYDELLARNDIDAVYISLPVRLIADWAERAAGAGKHVLCEKSAVVSFAAAGRLVEAFSRNGVRGMEGFSFRWHPQHAEVRRLAEDGTLGEPFLFDGRFGFPPLNDDNIRYRADLGGGALNDAGCYTLYASRMAFGAEPSGVMASLTTDKHRGVDIRGTAYLEYSGGRAAFAAFGFDNAYQSTYTVWGSKGLVTLGRAYAIPGNMDAPINVTTQAVSQQHSLQAVDQFQLMVNGYCDDLLSPGSAPFTFEEDLLEQARAMEAIRVSSRERRFVHLSEIK